MNTWKKYEWIYNIKTYFDITERINEHFNNLKRNSDHSQKEDETFYLCVEILRMIPFKEKEEIKLNKKDGICLLKKHIPFLMEDLQKILLKNVEILLDIKSIRNKYEHEPHNVNVVFTTSSGTSFASVSIHCKEKIITINTMEFTYIIYDLNILMNKIKEYVCKIEKENMEEMDNLTKEIIENIRKRKNVEYNDTYIRIPRLIDLE